MNFHILRFDELDSTNSEAARQARLGAAEGTCILANRQTAGRGRHGRTWVSEDGAGLYFSIVLRPALEMSRLPLITLMAGVAVLETLTLLGLTPDIKWVNDVLINGRKIAGILSEAVETPAGTAVIVGIGINITSSHLAGELCGSATSIEAETGSILWADDLAQLLTSELARFYAQLSAPGGSEAILDAWQRRSTYFRGKTVRVTLETETIEGVTDGLEDNGALRVAVGDGSVRIVHAGDVQRLRENGH
jgi:BirA family biotin operon repressor/biotin-[acetyl-CoA-carboxylase] ligase